MKPNDNLSEFEKQGAISRAWHSIRTRYSLMTAFFIAIALLTFYIGGRIVLVHLVRDTERQMVEIGLDVRRSLEAGRSPLDEKLVRSEPSFFDVAADFYSGGFWNADKEPVVIELPVKVEDGRVVETRKVSIAKLFSDVARSAIWRLLFAVAIVGIAFVLPIFWFQSRILLNPLTKMTEEIADLGRRTADTDCPRLDWSGKDEFAQLAVSVNRMVETIAAKTVSLANSEASHQALIDGVPDGLVVFDTAGRLVSITKEPEGVCPLSGFFRGEGPSPAVFGAEPVREFTETVAKVVSEGIVGKVRLKVQRPLGVPRSVPTRHFEVRLTRLGERFVLAIIRDVTSEVAEHKLRLAAEQRSLDASKRESLTGLAAGIAHDMNNILSIVLNAAEAEEADPSGDSTKTLETIRDAIRRGSGMMRELMTFAGENRMQLQRATPKLVMDDARQLVAGLLKRNIELAVCTDEGAPDVDVDTNQIWKIFFNIVKNAAEAIGTRPGRIEMSASPFRMTASEAVNFLSEGVIPEGEGVLFRVRDDGPGIEPELLGRLFDPYVSTKAVGRGLGLATVRTIVEAHGGGLRVKSVLDRGTDFEIFLPASRLAASVAPAASASAASGGQSGGDILIVDDDDSILKTTAILLKAMGYRTHLARNRREALAVVRRYPQGLKLIVLDARLGGIDTVRLLDAFRIGAPKVPVAVSSGSAADEIAKMFRSHPYDAFLAKPYTLAELKSLLGSLKG